MSQDNTDTSVGETRPSRRTVTRAAAWSVPVVGVATVAPAYAASCASLTPVAGSVEWDSYTGNWWSARYRWSRASSYEGTYTLAQSGADTLLVTVGAAYEGTMAPLASRTLRYDAPVGGLGVSGLCLAQYNTRDNARSSNRRQDRGAYTVTFGRPVSNLSFSLTDVDSATGDYLDMIEISATVAYTEVGAKGSKVKGAGTSASPYTATANNTNLNDATSGDGNVRVNFAGPVSSFTVTYWNDVGTFTEDTTQGVWISDMSFTYSPQAGC